MYFSRKKGGNPDDNLISKKIKIKNATHFAYSGHLDIVESSGPRCPLYPKYIYTVIQRFQMGLFSWSAMAESELRVAKHHLLPLICYVTKLNFLLINILYK